MFCPNCGTQNPDAAETCAKCHFHVKGTATPKFKGTMLLMNQPSSAPPPRPSSTPPPAGTPGPMPNKLKGTMVGVAPPVPPGPLPRGGYAGAPAGELDAAPAPGQASHSAPVASPGVPGAGSAVPGGVAPRFGQQTVAFGLPPGGGFIPPAGGYASPHPGAPAAEGNAFSPPVPQPGVNPLGGTLAADQAAFPPPYAAAPPGAGPDVRAALQATAMMPDAAAGGSPFSPYGGPGAGAPPRPPHDVAPNAPSYGEVAPSNPFEPPPGYRGASAGYGANSWGAQPDAGVIPYGQGAALDSARAAGPAPTRRNPSAVLLVPVGLAVFGAMFAALVGLVIPALSFLGWLIALAGVGLAAWLTIQMVNELKSVTGNAAFPVWGALVPFYNAFVVPPEVVRAKQLRGSAAPVRSTVLYVLVFLYALASDVNDLAR